MQHRRGAALFPFADAVVETQQMGEALWVLQGRPLALGALGRGRGEGRRARIRTPYTPLTGGAGQALISSKSPGFRRHDHRGREFWEPSSFYKTGQTQRKRETIPYPHPTPSTE